MTAPVVEVLSIVRSDGAGQLGQLAVIVPVVILTSSSPDPMFIPSVSKIL